MKTFHYVLAMTLALIINAFSGNVIGVHAGNAVAGDTGKFIVYLQNDVPVNGLNFILRYDPALITPTHISPVGRASFLNGSRGALIGGDRISCIVYDAGMTFMIVDSGEIFEIAYLVSGAITDSTAAILMFVEGLTADSNITIVPFEYIDGRIEISPVVGVRAEHTGIPEVYQLYQNYPNPFNPRTIIGFDLPVSSRVSLTVFNILGQRVTTVLEAERSAGRYSCTLDATSWASGVYFIRFEASASGNRAPTYAQVMKMALIK